MFEIIKLVCFIPSIILGCSRGDNQNIIVNYKIIIIFAVCLKIERADDNCGGMV